MNRAIFQELADLRIEEAGVLLTAQKWDGAYYLAGYAVECALKACIAKLTNQYDFPPERKEWEACYTHDFDKLLRQAKLEAQQQAEAAGNIDFKNSWVLARAWNESSRYRRKSQTDAEALYNVIANPVNGVLPWLKKFW